MTQQENHTVEADSYSKVQGGFGQCLMNNAFSFVFAISMFAIVPHGFGAKFDPFSAFVCGCTVFLVQKIASFMTTISVFWNWYKSQNYSLRILVDLTISMAVASLVVTIPGVNPTTYASVAVLTIIHIWNVVNNNNTTSDLGHKKLEA